MPKDEEYGYIVALPWEGFVFVVADTVDEALSKMTEQDIVCAGFESHTKVKVIR